MPNVRKTMSKKRKLSSGNHGNPAKKPVRKLKTHEQRNQRKDKDSSIGGKTEADDASLKISDQENKNYCNLATRVKKEEKIQISKTRKAAKSMKDNHGDLPSQESSDDLPLSHISKKRKEKRTTNKQLSNVNSKVENSSFPNREGHKVEAKLNIVKTTTKLGDSVKTPTKAKNSKDVSIVPSALEVNINKISVSEIAQKSHSKSKTNISREEKSKTPLSSKRKGEAKKVESVKGSSLFKQEQNPIEIISKKENSIVNREQAKKNVLKGLVKQTQEIDHEHDNEGSDADGEDSEMEWEDVAG